MPKWAVEQIRTTTFRKVVEANSPKEAAALAESDTLNGWEDQQNDTWRTVYIGHA